MATSALKQNQQNHGDSNAQQPTVVRRNAPCAVSGIFQDRQAADQVLRRLIDLGVKRENISLIGKDLRSETQITGFVGRGDVIKDGLQTGAIFGAFFGTMLSLLSGFGVLFVPFVGAVVAGGPIGAALLGAASGAISGGAGAGIVSALASLGMPKEKAAIYETKIKAGGLMLTAEVETDRVPDIETLFREHHGEEILSCQEFIPSRFDTGRISSIQDLPESIKSRLSPEAQATFVQVYNETYAEKQNQHVAAYRAWMTVEEQYEQDNNGVWKETKQLQPA